MANCQIYDDQTLITYLQNNMDREEMDRLQFHLLQCKECRERLESLRRLADSMVFEEEEKEEEENGQGDKKILPGVGRGLIFRLAASVALLIGLSFGGYYLFSPDGIRPSIDHPNPTGNNGQPDSTHFQPTDSTELYKGDSIGTTLTRPDTCPDSQSGLSPDRPGSDCE